MQAIFILLDHYDSYPEWNAGYLSTLLEHYVSYPERTPVPITLVRAALTWRNIAHLHEQEAVRGGPEGVPLLAAGAQGAAEAGEDGQGGVQVLALPPAVLVQPLWGLAVLGRPTLPSVRLHLQLFHGCQA